MVVASSVARRVAAQARYLSFESAASVSGIHRSELNVGTITETLTIHSPALSRLDSHYCRR